MQTYFKEIILSTEKRKKKRGVVLGVAFKGDEKVTFWDEDEKKWYKCRYYKTWYQMITRCYSEKDRLRKPHQSDVTCCKDWLYFPNFKKWMLAYEDKYGSTLGLVLDKDIPVMGNREYHPDKCCFITRELNMIFAGTTKTSKNGTGVYEHKYPIGRKRFQAFITIEMRKKSLGLYCTAIEAHRQWQLATINKIEDVINTLTCDVVIKGLRQRVEVIKEDINYDRFTGRL